MEGPGALQGQFRLFLAPFWLHFGSNLAPFWLIFGPVGAPGRPRGPNCRRSCFGSPFSCFLAPFWVHFGLHLGSFWGLFSILFSIRFLHDFGCLLGPILASILARFWGHFEVKIRYKFVPQFGCGSGVDFWSPGQPPSSKSMVLLTKNKGFQRSAFSSPGDPLLDF